MQRAERDWAAIEARVHDLPSSRLRSADLFSAVTGDIWLSRAPGRLDVMGGIADYSGSLVLQLPLADATCAAVARADDEWVRIVSGNAPTGRLERELRLPAAEVWRACRSWNGARAYVASLGASGAWGGYVLGGLVELVERGARAAGGLRVLIDSTLPEGAGVSSSAALEVAALGGLAAACEVQLAGRELALACQRVENLILGSPCGVMDQMASVCGEQDRLLALLCRPAELQTAVGLPPAVSVFGIDSGVRHAVAGAPYRRVRAAAFMGYRILAERFGARVRSNGDGSVVLEDDALGGYLTSLRPEQLGAELLAALPEQLTGAEFLARFAGTTDPVTRVEPSTHYAVRAATLHPIAEHARVQAFAEAVSGSGDEAELRRAGQLMLASHASYADCGLASDGTDELVAAVCSAGPGSGVFGARISGGGSGGCVVVLARSDVLPRLEAVARAYAARTGRVSRVFAGSSPGAAALPVRLAARLRAAPPSS